MATNSLNKYKTSKSHLYLFKDCPITNLHKQFILNNLQVTEVYKWA